MNNKILLISAFILIMLITANSGRNTLKAGEYYKIRMTFNKTVITAKLYDNATTRSFIKKLPLTLPMRNLYEREMVYRFPDPLPAEETATRGYKVGEIIYYPPLHSFVIMYAQNGERFNMQSMGYVENNIEVFRGIERTDILFEQQ